MTLTHEQVRERLLETLRRVFDDAVLDSEEREELKRLYRHGGLTVSEVKQVFEDFLLEVWGEVYSDGRVSEFEHDKLEAIVRELHLPPAMVPDKVKAAIDHRPIPEE